MNEDAVRERAAVVGEALIAGDVDRIIGILSAELQRNPGEVVSLLPLPATEVNVESIERTASGFAVVLELIGATDQTRLQTRWKERDGEPTIVEISHLSRAEREPGVDEGGVGGAESADVGESSEATPSPTNLAGK